MWTDMQALCGELRCSVVYWGRVAPCAKQACGSVRTVRVEWQTERFRSGAETSLFQEAW